MLSYPICIVGCHAQIAIYVQATMYVRRKSIKQAARDEKEQSLRRGQSYFVLSAQNWKHRGHTPNPDRKIPVGSFNSFDRDSAARLLPAVPS